MSGISDDSEQVFKTVVIGRSGVGKSTILLRFVENKFIDLPTTVGADVQTKSVQIEQTRFKLQLWDTAGQERYRTIVKNFFNLSKAACIIFSLTDESSLEDAKYWLEELTQRCGVQLPKLLLGNKCDMLTPTELNQTLEEWNGRIQQLKKDYSCEFQVVSGKTGENVGKAFDRLGQLIYQHYLKKKVGGNKKMGVKLSQMRGEKEEEKKKCC